MSTLYLLPMSFKLTGCEVETHARRPCIPPGKERRGTSQGGRHPTARIYDQAKRKTFVVRTTAAVLTW